MGNSPISIGLRTEQSHYGAGDAINGTVYVNILEQQQVHEIQLSLTGKEDVMVHFTRSESERDGESGERTRDYYDEATSEFLRVDYPLQRFPAQLLLPGQYEFPFSISLPQTLPSSFRCTKRESHCKVEYKLTATFLKRNAGIFSSNPYSEQKLNIRSTPLKDENIYDTSLELPMDEVPVSSCCCCKNGVMNLQAKFNKTIVQPNDFMDVLFRCENQSPIQVKKVQLELLEKIEWKGGIHGQKETVKKVLACKEINAKHFHELAARRQNSGYTQYSVNSLWRVAQLKIPGMIHDSYEGRNMQVRHIVSIQLVTKGCCTTSPNQTASIKVYQKLPSGANSTSTLHQEDTPGIPSAPSSMYNENTSAFSHSSPFASMVPMTNQNEVQDWKETVVDAEMVMANEVYTDTVPSTTSNEQDLPPNWHAEPAEVVHIPMADAVILEDSSWNLS